MINLLRKNNINLQLKKGEMLQIAFDKKNIVERIFNEDGEDVYYSDSKDIIVFKRIGTLFLNYLSDDVSEIFNKFIDDVISSKDIIDVESKYINAYTFYFKYFFKNNYYIEQLEYLKSLNKEKIEQIKQIVIKKIQVIEDVTTLEELLKCYTSLIPVSPKVKNGANFKNVDKDYLHIALLGKFAKISRYFFKIAYVKQLYKLVVDYCYFRLPVINVDIEKNNKILRYIYFKDKYEELLRSFKGSDIIPKLTLALPSAIATVNEDGEIMYCYQIDESEVSEYIYTNLFFNASLLNMLEAEQNVFRCKLCNSYNILRKSGTEYCNNLSPYSENQTCSDYAKNHKFSEKLRNEEGQEIAKEEKKKKDREKARIKRNPYHTKERKEEESRKVDKEIRKKRLRYEKGTLKKEDYLSWLKNKDIIT